MSLSRRIKKLWAKLAEPGALRVLYHGLALAPRLLVHVASVAALAALVGACVPATRYEEAKSASEVELAGRQHAEAELRATHEKLDALSQELEDRQQKLSETEQSVSETKLENSVAVKERDEATGLVDQLRGELARVGDDLRTFAKQKADLEKSLDAAQAREKSDARTVAIARLTRDLTSALGDRVTSGDVSVDVQNGRVVVSAPAELWFDEGAALRTGSDGMLGSGQPGAVVAPGQRARDERARTRLGQAQQRFDCGLGLAWRRCVSDQARIFSRGARRACCPGDNARGNAGRARQARAGGALVQRRLSAGLKGSASVRS